MLGFGENDFSVKDRTWSSTYVDSQSQFLSSGWFNKPAGQDKQLCLKYLEIITIKTEKKSKQTKALHFKSHMRL